MCLLLFIILLLNLKLLLHHELVGQLKLVNFYNQSPFLDHLVTQVYHFPLRFSILLYVPGFQEVTKQELFGYLESLVQS